MATDQGTAPDRALRKAGDKASVDPVNRRPRAATPAHELCPGQVLQLDWAELPTRPPSARLRARGVAAALLTRRRHACGR